MLVSIYLIVNLSITQQIWHILRKESLFFSLKLFLLFIIILASETYDMFGSDSEMIKITFTIFKDTIKLTFNHLKSISISIKLNIELILKN